MKGIDGKLAKAIELHLDMEAGNALAYLTAYSWLRANGWEGFAKRYKNDALDELGHAQNFVKYLAKRGVSCLVDATLPDEGGLDSVDAIAIVAAGLEEATERSMAELVRIAEEVSDPAAVEWISGKLVEQELESKKASDFAARVSDAAKEPGALVLLDRRLEHGGW